MQQEFLGAPYTCKIARDGTITWNNPAVAKAKQDTSVVTRMPLEGVDASHVVGSEESLVRGWFLRNDLDVLQEGVGVFVERDEVAVVDFVVENDKQVFLFWVYRAPDDHVKKPDGAMREYANRLLQKVDTAYNFDCVVRFLCVSGDRLRCMHL